LRLGYSSGEQDDSHTRISQNVAKGAAQIAADPRLTRHRPDAEPTFMQWGHLNNPPKPADAQRSGASAGYPPGYSEPSMIYHRPPAGGQVAPYATRAMTWHIHCPRKPCRWRHAGDGFFLGSSGFSVGSRVSGPWVAPKSGEGRPRGQKRSTRASPIAADRSDPFKRSVFCLAALAGPRGPRGGKHGRRSQNRRNTTHRESGRAFFISLSRPARHYRQPAFWPNSAL